MGRLGDFYTYWVYQKQQLTYRYVVFNQTAEGVYVDTTILLDLKQPTPKLSNTAAQARGGPYRNSTLTNMLRWDMPEALNVWSQEVYGVSVGDGRGGENYKAKILSYARSLYRQDSVGLEFRNPHETLRVLELLESRIVSQELNSLTTTPNYFGLFSDEVGQY